MTSTATEDLTGDAATPCCSCCCPFFSFSRKRSDLHEPLTSGAEQEEPELQQPGHADAEEAVLHSPRARSRAKVVEEIMVTEKAYVADLELLAKHFMPVLQAHIAEKQAEELPDCNSLLRVHQELLQRLNATGSTAAAVAAAFRTMTPFLRMYSSYCAAYEIALQAADELRNKGPTLEELEATHGDRIDSLLIKPVQRLCKYPLFFSQLLQLLPEGHAERPELQKVAEAVSAINAEVNGKVRGSDEAAQLLLLHQKLGGKVHDLLAPTRRLHLQADVRLASERSHQKRRSVLVVLSDVLLIARHRRALARPLARTREKRAPLLWLKAVLPLEACLLKPAPTGGAELQLLCSAPAHVYYRCTCKSEQDAAKLLSAFGEAKAAHAASRAGNERRRSSAGMDHAAMAAEATAAIEAERAAAERPSASRERRASLARFSLRQMRSRRDSSTAAPPASNAGDEEPLGLYGLVNSSGSDGADSDSSVSSRSSTTGTGRSTARSSVMED